MFGMGFAEILIIVVIAILFLGPDKLPQTMIEIARFFRNAKSTIASAKSSIEEELHLEDIKREVDGYKNNLLDEKSQLAKSASLDTITDEFDAVVDMTKETPPAEPAKPVKSQTASKPEVVTFSKKKTTTDATVTEGKNDV